MHILLSINKLEPRTENAENWLAKSNSDTISGHVRNILQTPLKNALSYSVSILYGNIASLWSLEPFLAKKFDIASIQTLWEIIPLSSFFCLDNYLMVTVKKHQFEGRNSIFKNLNFEPLSCFQGWFWLYSCCNYHAVSYSNWKIIVTFKNLNFKNCRISEN